VGLIGAVVLVGGGLAAIAYWLFRIFSEKWLTTKFEERLAAYKHAQQRELEHVRLEINTLLDRTIKLHQREFDILPQAWSLFNDAYWKISGFMGFKSYPDLNQMSSIQIEEFLKNTAMAEWQKDELRSKSDKATYYIDYAERMEIVDAYRLYSNWQNFFLKNGIFMPAEIKKKFSELDSLLKGALIEYEIRKREKDIKWSEMTDYRRLLKDGKNLRDEVEAEVHKRLWSSTKTE
jgi:hypothetical protein